MSRAHGVSRRRRRIAYTIVGLVGAGAVTWTMTLAALASGSVESQEIVCPTPQIGAVPAAARAEVDRELANLDRQLSEANTRLQNTAGQGGPDFVQNAILGPLASKRTAALDRIAIAIGRVSQQPQGLDRFATCTLGDADAASPAAPPATTTPGQAAAQTIVCPTPQVGAVPAAARAEVDRELANLDRQLSEANTRLQNTAGQGGPDFVQNAILGPLASKRTAALDRIAIAIGRVVQQPEGLDRFATCALR